MARYRLTKSAKDDIGSILGTSEKRHGHDARRRYSALLLAAMRHVAEDPEGRSTSDRSELRPGIRSFHLRYSRGESGEARVANPVHVLFYRAIGPGSVEIARVLHDRMEPRGHIGSPFKNQPDEPE